MSNNNIVIREISVADNIQIAQVIRDVLVELGAPKVGTAYEDVSLNNMMETYTNEKAAYFVIERQGKILGGAGIAPLDGFEDLVCELQKMYFLKEARGLGLGEILIQKCMERAKVLGFKKCYLETLPFMVAAQKLYTKVGFESLDKPLGNTGHYSCDVWMIKAL
ncbi:GNAT family N-acetyltransferase [Xanthomarina sp. F2636L]|uniref:GNAT family N-acetyltransferase n=1 Tax=Xanthomarina sp. F2636L TaxID=2996018 RepID=UPI00225E6774|nr:GNAT family N-acetyltransferase [Xanthomarina sp. F2636L]MCX7552202.1 GNAT family N-acetyltransferase [Xanthomarina sp. F2636L]